VVGPRELDEHGMVCDLDALRAALQQLVARVDGKDLEEIRPPEAEAVTVEVLARWAHQTLVPALQQAGGDSLAVRGGGEGPDFRGSGARGGVRRERRSGPRHAGREQGARPGPGWPGPRPAVRRPPPSSAAGPRHRPG